MKRAAEESRRAKRDVIVIGDADEPPVKKEGAEPAPSAAEFAELRQQLKQSEEKFQNLCDLYRRDTGALKAQVEHLEKRVDSKEGILKNANNASVEDELKKKVDELANELEEGRKRSNELRLRDCKRIVELESQLAEEKQNSAVLQQKLGQVEAQLMQQPPTIASCSDLDTATGSLDSHHQPADDKVVSPEGKPQTSKEEPTVVDLPQPPSDPRPKYRKIEPPTDLIVPTLTVDDQYTGIPPKREVTISNLNDNVNKEFLMQLARKQKLEPEDVIVFYHPTTKKHLKMALILFRSSNDARLFVDSNNKTTVMGMHFACRLDPYAAELSWMYANSTCGNLPRLPHLSGMSERVLSLRRERLIQPAVSPSPPPLSPGRHYEDSDRDQPYDSFDEEMSRRGQLPSLKWRNKQSAEKRGYRRRK